MNLPNEMINEILKYGNYHDIDNLCKTNKNMQSRCQRELWREAYDIKYHHLYKISYKIIDDVVDNFVSSFCEITVGSTKYRLCTDIPISIIDDTIYHHVCIDKNPMGMYDVTFNTKDIPEIDHRNYSINRIYRFSQNIPCEFTVSSKELPKLLYELKQHYWNNHRNIKLNNHSREILHILGFIVYDI